MNILLINAKEVVQDKVVMEFKEVLIRGNNVMYMKKSN